MATAARRHGFNCGTIVDGEETIEQVGERIYRELLSWLQVIVVEVKSWVMEPGIRSLDNELNHVIATGIIVLPGNKETNWILFLIIRGEYGT